MPHVNLTEIISKMKLENLTPEVEVKGIKITQPDINRPALQLAGYFEHHEPTRVQIIGFVEYSYMEAGHEDLTEELEAAGAVVLNYQSIDIDVKGNQIRLGGLYEYGFETGMQSEEENERAIPYLEEYADTDRYLIMCAHRPESFYPWDMADQWGIDLVLSGHLHGGQVIIPGVGGLYNSLDGFFPKFDYGQYKLGDSDMVITRGLGSNPKMLPRFNNPPEIAVVEVE